MSEQTLTKKWVPHMAFAYDMKEVDQLVATLTARCEALAAQNDALEEDADVDRLRIEALTAERDYWKAQVDDAKARFNRDLQNYSSGYTQALDDALKGKP